MSRRERRRRLDAAARWALAVLLVVELAPLPLSACTTAVISGAATPDGRPLLWKNRDISTTANSVVRLTGGRYDIVAVVNSGGRSSVWMGVNSAGLCIENSVTKDLAAPGAKGPGNGSFMLQVLQTCGTVGDVKALLEQTDETGRATNANYGVIDAQGGAALFEASATSHRMFDANDPLVAPQGFIVRSNFSFTGREFEQPPTREQLVDVYSAERYFRAEALLTDAGRRAATAQYLLRHCARDLADADGAPYCGTVNGPPGELPGRVATANTISRTTTVSFAVFQGVRPGEDPALTTMWVGLGDPKFTVAVPCWVAAGEVPEELRGSQISPVCQAARSLREQFFIEAENGIQTEGLADVWEELWGLEDQFLERVERKLIDWRASSPDAAAMRALQVSSAEQVLATLKGRLRVAAPAAAATE